MSSGNSLLIIGSGGHGRVVLDIALSTGRYSQIDFATNVDNPDPIGDFRILDERELSPELIASGYESVAVAIGDNRARLSKARLLVSFGAHLPALVHPSAVVSPSASLGVGTVVCAGAVVNASARTGAACIVNTGAVVEHECVLEDGVHMSPGSLLGGGCIVGEEAWLCIGSSAVDHVRVAPGSVLAGGSCLVVDADEPGLYAGVPARLKRRLAR